MQLEQIFFTIWSIFVVSIISIFLIKGRKSLKKFPKLEKGNLEYSENFVSGYSTQSFKTQIGGAQKILKIKVTKNQLWITTYPFMAWICEQFDLLHLIPITSILSIDIDKKTLNIEFEKNGRNKKIVIISKNHKELFRVLNNKIGKK